MNQDQPIEKELTANQLYKNYRDEGGTLKFSDWLTREKTKGVFPINGNLDVEVKKTIMSVKRNSGAKRTILGMPVGTLVAVGAVLIAAVVISKIMTKKQQP
jgi:hypothetical protein